jgi:hypothetical protein
MLRCIDELSKTLLIYGGGEVAHAQAEVGRRVLPALETSSAGRARCER